MDNTWKKLSKLPKENALVVLSINSQEKGPFFWNFLEERLYFQNTEDSSVYMDLDSFANYTVRFKQLDIYDIDPWDANYDEYRHHLDDYLIKKFSLLPKRMDLANDSHFIRFGQRPLYALYLPKWDAEKMLPHIQQNCKETNEK